MPNVASMRLLRRFLKPGQIVEIRERTVAQASGFEFFVFINGSLIESQLFHGNRLGAYAEELRACCAEFLEGGWIEDPTATPRSHG